MTNLERSMELIQVPRSLLPAKAREIAAYLIGKVGVCMEVYITAYAFYAQLCEGLPADGNEEYDIYKFPAENYRNEIIKIAKTGEETSSVS